jgi:signal transduction histidine kinase/ActR/RegA family two-component response regulator
LKHHVEERLRRQSAQQEALANLGSSALSGRAVSEICGDAVKAIARILEVRSAEIWRLRQEGTITLAASHGDLGFTPEAIEPMLIANHSSIREARAIFMIGGTAGSAGALAATALQPLRPDEIHFLNAVANLLAQAIVREDAEEELRSRAAQQVAIAQFGRFALLGITPELLEHLCDVVKTILHVDYAAFLALDRESDTFRLSAGSWWVSDDYRVPADESTLAGYTVLHGGPVIVTDYETETRFEARSRFVDAGIVSGMAAEIRGERNLHGVLMANSRTRRTFSDTDARFLQALANAAAEAMERESAQRALAESEARYRDVVEQTNRVNSLGRLAATIAHEFNNVLMGISPFVELLKRHDIEYERRLAALDHMAKSIGRGRRITEEILRFTNPAEPVLEAISLEQWAQGVANEMRPLLGMQYKMHVKVHQHDLRVLADSGQLHQVISNLVLNARDAMPQGGTITIRMSREEPEAQFDFGVVPEAEKFIHLTVEDEGTGMAPETKRHIFEPLFTTKRTGTGLGLAITHQIVQRHGGMIFVVSEPGEGSCFHLFLRAANGDSPKRNHDARVAAAAGKRRVLLVEDDLHVATGIALMLQEENFVVDVVHLGADALDAIERIRPDVVVLDIGLPDVEGTKVYANIAASHPDLPVIFSTGHGDERKLEPFLARGNVAMLLKPYDMQLLVTTINRLTAPSSV